MAHMVDDHSPPNYGNFRYLIVNPKNGGIRDLALFLLKKDTDSYSKFLQPSDDEVLDEMLQGRSDDDDDGGDPPSPKWVLFVSILVRKIIAFFGKPMEWFGLLVEFILNVLTHNGGFLALLYNFIRGKVIMPERGSETFISAIGHLDGRIDLYKRETELEAVGESDPQGVAIQAEIGSRTLIDLCVMASKLAYENSKVVRNVVNLHWKMHFVEFYNCWNDYQKENSTQVFIMCDKPRDANLILVSFRGTEPFDADDWGTDFDYSWYEIPKLGKVHMGFLEALGLGNRMNATSFREQLVEMNIKNNIDSVSGTAFSFEGSKLTSSSLGSDTKVSTKQSLSSQQLSRVEEKEPFPLMGERTAYYAVRSKLKRLLLENKNAKFVVTGHSLGGALAILFPTVLVLHEEEETLKRLLAVYTFGQPRIGNRQLVRFMEGKLNRPIPRYFRVVYCNDLVPRLPYDDKTFLYKHFGECLYYNSFYVRQEVGEEPNRNYFGARYLIPEYLNAVWELVRSFLIGYTKGLEYKEGWESRLLRVAGLGMPGISAHSPVDYVNSVRIGRERSLQMSSL